MLKIPELFHLVKSLSKTERRYLRVSMGDFAGSSYGRLYGLMEDACAYDAQLVRQLDENFPGQTLEPARKHLYKVLMRCLRQYDAGKEVETSLWEIYHNSRLLLEKGLYQAALRQLEKGKADARRFEKFHFFGMFSRLQLQYMVQQQFDECDEMTVVACQEEAREMLEAEEKLRQHTSLYELLLCRYWKNGVARSLQEQTRLNDLILEEHQTLQSTGDSLESDKLHLHFQSVYLLMTGDVEGSLQAFYALDELFQANPVLWMGNPSHYMQFLNDILQTLRRLERFDEMDFFLARLEALASTSQSLFYRITLQVREHRLHRLLAVRGVGSMAGVEDSLYDQEVEGKEQLPPQMLAQWWLTLARAYLYDGRTAEALTLINRGLNTDSAAMSRMLYSKYRLLNLMIHKSLDNRDYLHYEIRALERKLKKGDAWFRTEKLVVHLLRDWLNNKPADALTAQLQALEADPYEQHIISELGLKKWANEVQKVGGERRPHGVLRNHVRKNGTF